MTPRRIHRKRVKGWRMPPNTVYVGRGSKWGNPFRVGDPGVPDAYWAASLYRSELFRAGAVARSILLDELRGKNLCCWCPLDQPCHADVLLAIANSKEGHTNG